MSCGWKSVAGKGGKQASRVCCPPCSWVARHENLQLLSPGYRPLRDLVILAPCVLECSVTCKLLQMNCRIRMACHCWPIGWAGRELHLEQTDADLPQVWECLQPLQWCSHLHCQFEMTAFTLEIAAGGFPYCEGSLLMLWDLGSPFVWSVLGREKGAGRC